jgi:hypothetical protein
VSVTGTHYIKVNAGVKNYVRNTYTSDSTNSGTNPYYRADYYCDPVTSSDKGTAIINNDSSRSSVADCADACEFTLGCTYFVEVNNADYCYYQSSA